MAGKDVSTSASGSAKNQLSIIIPAFNEEQAIGAVLQNLEQLSFPWVREIVVVDDGSTDRTREIAQKNGARVIGHGRNLGYGAALKTGIRAAVSEFVLTMDSDGQHRARDVNRFWEVADSNDMVVGLRSKGRHSPLWRLPGKWLLSRMAQYLTGTRIPDLNCGFRVLRRASALKYLHLCPSGFSFSTTITMAFLSRGYRVSYLPIEVDPRVGKSTVSIKTGFATLLLVLRIATLFGPLRVFVPASLIIGAIGALWGLPIALAGRGISVGSMLAIVTSILLFGLGLLSDQISQLRMERFE